MSKSESLNDLKRLAYAKHGEDWAESLSSSDRFGNPLHKATWRAILAEPARTPDQVLSHQQWQQEIQMKFFGRTWNQEQQ